MKKAFITLIVTIALFAGMYELASIAIKKDSQQQRDPGSAVQGGIARLATSSTLAAGPGTNKNMLFTENTVCTSRVITTGANPIMLSFSAAEFTGTATSTGNPGPNIGFLQAASTTVAYDSGIYGCPAVSAYGYSASTTISIAEFR